MIKFTNRQQTWKGVTKLLFWGSVESAVLTLITVLFGGKWPSVALRGDVLHPGASTLIGAAIFGRPSKSSDERRRCEACSAVRLPPGGRNQPTISVSAKKKAISSHSSAESEP